jgi:hypothetical protein
MAILGNEKRIAEFMEGKLDTGVTRKSFEERFRSYVAAEHLQQKVGKKQMGLLFKIVDQFWRGRVASKAAKEQRLLKDYRASLRLIDGTKERLNELLRFAERFPTTRPSLRTTPVADFIRDAISTVQKRLEPSLDETYRDVEGNLSMLVALHPKREVNELIIDLVRFISDEYPKMKKKDHAALIGAAVAGAGLLREDELADEPQERVPRKIFLAIRDYKKHYQDAGEGRVFPVLKRPTQKKQQGLARKRRKL